MMIGDVVLDIYTSRIETLLIFFFLKQLSKKSMKPIFKH